MEFWCQEEDELWHLPDEELIDIGKKEIRQTGLIGDAEILDGKVYRINRCYPIYSRGYRDVLEPIENYLKTVKNLMPIGRYGAFKYNNQDHSILMGLMAAENILNNKGNDLWEINTDYEEYQEASIITKTGLQKQ